MITIGKRGSSEVDVTTYMLEEEGVELGQERERGAFKRVVDDVHLAFINFSGYFTTLFASEQPTTRWIVRVKDDAGRSLFLGEVDNESVTFSADKESVRFDAFSLNKIFWDQAKVVRLRYNQGFPRGHVVPYPYTLVYVTVSEILRLELTADATIKELFNGFDVDSTYSSRQIRGWRTSLDQNVGDNGRYRLLAQDTTLDELLTAMAKYYNAEFFIDAETEKFTMRRRGDALRSYSSGLEGNVRDDTEIDVLLVSEDRYDYVETIFRIPDTDPPTWLGTQGDVNGTIGYFKYRTSTMFIQGEFIAESAASAETDIVYLPAVPSGDNIIPSSATLKIPAVAAGITKRRLWRQTWTVIGFDDDGAPTGYRPISQYYLVREIDGSAEQTIQDGFSQFAHGDLTYLNDVHPSGRLWLGYDPVLNSWRVPIIDDGLTPTPTGRILNVTPELRFLSGNAGGSAEASLLDLIAFFGGASDFDVTKFQHQWKPVFVFRKKLKAHFRGIGYRVGDKYPAPQNVVSTGSVPLLKNEELVVNKARNDLVNDVTELQLETAVE